MVTTAVSWLKKMGAELPKPEAGCQHCHQTPPFLRHPPVAAKEPAGCQEQSRADHRSQPLMTTCGQDPRAALEDRPRREPAVGTHVPPPVPSLLIRNQRKRPRPCWSHVPGKGGGGGQGAPICGWGASCQPWPRPCCPAPHSLAAPGTRLADVSIPPGFSPLSGRGICKNSRKSTRMFQAKRPLGP